MLFPDLRFSKLTFLSLLADERFWAEESASPTLYHTLQSGAESSSVKNVFCKQLLHPLAPRSLSSISNVLSSHFPRKATLIRYKGVLISGKTFIPGNQICGNSTRLPSEQSLTKLNKTSLFIIVVIVLQLHNNNKKFERVIQNKGTVCPKYVSMFL